MKIAVYTIARNEANQVRPYIDSCRDADVVVVADTGSTDGTPELLRREGAIVQQVVVKPWRFDVARTTALCLVPGDVDVCICLDLDERLTPGWRQELERCWAQGTTRLRYWYVWNWKAPGVPDTVFRNDRIHARGGYVYRYPSHEVLRCTGTEVMAESELTIHQFPQMKERPDDLPLLELAVREDRCARTVFYLGREEWQRRTWQRAVTILQEYLTLHDARWASERSHAMRMIGVSYQRLGDVSTARSWLMRACAEDARLRENWIDLAQLCHDQQDWADGYAAALKALAISERPRHYFSFGYAWGERAHDLASVCAWYLGLKAQAAEYVCQALALNPEEPRLVGNAAFILGESRLSVTSSNPIPASNP